LFIVRNQVTRIF